MEKKDRELLLQDLSARLPYGVKVTWDSKHSLTVTPHIYCAIISEDNINNLPKLLLRPMSSMTEEERMEYELLANHCIVTSIGFIHLEVAPLIDWYNASHIDYRGLIPKGLAIEAPEEMYN